MGKSIRITGVWLLVLAFYMPLMAQKNIAFADGVNKQKELNLSDVASGVRYIPLETTTESLLDKDILDVTFTADYLFVCDYVNLFQFTPEGKFVRKIGKAGEGPGEYTQSIMAVTYDEDAKLIFMSDFRKGKVLVYSFDGKYLYDIETQRGSMTTYRDKTGNLFGVTNEYLYSKDKRGKELFVYNTKGKELYSFHFRPEEGIRYPGIIFTYGILYDHQGSCRARVMPSSLLTRKRIREPTSPIKLLRRSSISSISWRRIMEWESSMLRKMNVVLPGMTKKMEPFAVSVPRKPNGMALPRIWKAVVLSFPVLSGIIR